jgi:hypothetical protein
MFKNKVYNFITAGTTIIAAVTLTAGIYSAYDIRRDFRESRAFYEAMEKRSKELERCFYLSIKLGSPIEELFKQAEDVGLVKRMKKEEGDSNINNF